MSTTKWAIDPTHSTIGFKVKHMMFTNVSGKFEQFDANIETEHDDFTAAHFEFTGQVESVNTGNADRDGHLRSADFFDAAQFPEIAFQSTSFRKDGDSEYKLEGNLTLHGVTKPITLEASYSGQMKDPWGNTKAAFAINGKINRKDWGLVWNAALETGGVLVGEVVTLDIELQFLKK